MSMGPKQLSHAISKVTRQSCSKKFVSLGRILMHWDQIMGEDMAQYTQPVKVQYRKPKTRRDRPSATLEIAAPSAQASLLHYQVDLILERINQIFGERWITAIRFIHIPANSSRRSYAKSQKPQITARDKQKLETMLDDISDPDLRLRLESLGRAMLVDNHTKN